MRTNGDLRKFITAGLLLMLIGLALCWQSQRVEARRAPAAAASLVTNLEQSAKLTAFDRQADDQLGRAVATSGDTIVVGAPLAAIGNNQEQGAAYVFVRYGGTSYLLQQKLYVPSPEGAAGDRFGVVVAISGDTIVVGANRAANTQGAAFVFVRTGQSWNFQQKLQANDALNDAQFGAAVAINGNTVAVGAPEAGYSGPLDRRGAVYVFTRSNNTWTQQQKLTANDAGIDDDFGASVALDGSALLGNTIVIGAYSDDVEKQGSNFPAVNQGSAYIFVLSGSTWQQQAKLLASDGDSSDYFGHSVAISGDAVALGAPGASINGQSDRGSVYLFTRTGANWSQQQKMVAADGAEDDLFGWSVALHNDTLIVGAVGDDTPITANQGAAYLFVRSFAGWIQAQKLVAFPAASQEYFGSAAALLNDTAVIGAPGDDDSRGAAYVFTTGGGCSFTLSPVAANFAALGGNATLTVTASSSNCAWTAVSNAPWLTISAGAGGTGNGTISFNVAQNTNATRRQATITIGAQVFTVYQGRDFLDVPVSHPFYDFIGKLSARGITDGCGNGNYCPAASVTREQMAAFIIRALHEPGYTPATPAQQRFADVAPASLFYGHIEELAVRSITTGCGGGNYCPAANVTREQMAAFIIRALHAPGYTPSIPAQQRFQDVPPANPFYAHIEELAVRQITLGCGGGNYCPASDVTRAQMAAFLVRAFGL